MSLGAEAGGARTPMWPAPIVLQCTARKHEGVRTPADNARRSEPEQSARDAGRRTDTPSASDTQTRRAEQREKAGPSRRPRAGQKESWEQMKPND